MAEEHQQGVPSTAAVKGHPIHPMLIPFPVTFLIAALGTDIGYWVTQDFFWARASIWLTGAGLVTGVIAAGIGQIDFWTIPRARTHYGGWVHFLGNVVVLVLAFASLLYRWDDPAEAVMPWGMTLSAIITVLLLIAAWYGGELIYRHKISVAGHSEERKESAGHAHVFPHEETTGHAQSERDGERS